MADTWNRSRRSALSSLEQRAVKVCAPRGIRHPEKLDPAAAALADRALQRIVDVMEEQVHSKRAKGVLSAAIEIREEICGPKVQKLQIEGSLEQILSASLVPAPASGVAEALPPASGVTIPALASEFQSPDSDAEPLELPTLD
jgi:hypothetical protein